MDTLSFRAKVRGLDFSFSSSRVPIGNLFSISIRFKFHPYLFKLKSEPNSSFSWKKICLKPKSLCIFKRAKKKAIVRRWLSPENYWKGRRIWLWILVAMAGCYATGQLLILLYKAFTWKFIYKASKYVISSGLLRDIYQALF